MSQQSTTGKPATTGAPASSANQSAQATEGIEGKANDEVLPAGTLRYFATFPNSSSYKDLFVELHVPDANVARELMNTNHGSRWGVLYNDDDKFDAQIKSFGLKRLCLLKVNKYGNYPALVG